MKFNINNRRYTGSKFKMNVWMKEIILNNCTEVKSFADLFAGTGVVTDNFYNEFDELIINDFLFSNKIIYEGFYGNGFFNLTKLKKIENDFKEIKDNIEIENYVSENFGGKYFSMEDARKIGWIREEIEKLLETKKINSREYNILLTSLIYSFDRSANTVGHYEAFMKKQRRSNFIFEMIIPKNTSKKSKVKIFNFDANELIRKISADVIYLDPPYSSRQYSRFYHVIDNIAEWTKPELFGIAAKPEPKNMSEYSRSNANIHFEDLVKNAKCKYLAVSYNNTYTSKSSSSKNKMSLQEIEEILNKKGNTKKFEINHKPFNSGKTEILDHKEILFLTEVF